ncbi:GLRA1 protein, partial [Polypterus senegalus]
TTPMAPSEFLDKLMGKVSGYDARIRPNFKVKTFDENVVRDGQQLIPANTSRLFDGVLPATWRCPGFPQGIMENGVRLHSPAGYRGCRQGMLQGDTRIVVSIITRKYSQVIGMEGQEHFRVTDYLKVFGKPSKLSWSWQEV